MPKACDIFDIEQRQRPARRLLETAIGVAVERPQQAGNVPVGARADTQQGFPRTGQELTGSPVIEGDAFSRLQPSNETTQLVSLGRSDTYREIARDIQIARSGKLQCQGCIA